MYILLVSLTNLHLIVLVQYYFMYNCGDRGIFSPYLDVQVIIIIILSSSSSSSFTINNINTS